MESKIRSRTIADVWIKRGLFEPTVPARGSGRLALYSWHDIIALRVFGEVVSVFGGRASNWAAGITDLRYHLEGHFFPTLWGNFAIFTDHRTAILGTLSAADPAVAALIVPLDPHIAVIADRILPEERQLELPLVTNLGSSR